MNLNPDVALDYLEFVENRHKVWERRQAGWEPDAWTDDPILAEKKFTNVFRILDPGTQFILTDLVPEDLGDRDALLRCFLYRHTGRVEVWEYLDMVCGLPTWDNLSAVQEALANYRDETKKPVFTGAYLVFPQSTEPGTDKVDSIVNLTRRLFHPDSPDEIMRQWNTAKAPTSQFKILRSNKGVADFMSMQILTDWGYLPQCGEDREHLFVQPGPGCVKGAKALAPDAPTLQVLHWAHKAVSQLDVELPIGRKPSLMDVQNTLCEFSKYHRYQQKPLSGVRYRPAHPGVQTAPVYPQHWSQS